MKLIKTKLLCTCTLFSRLGTLVALRLQFYCMPEQALDGIPLG